LTSPARHLPIAIAMLAALALAQPAAAIDVHAHRGGGLKHGAPVALENSLSAFKSARARGASVVELDVHVSKNHVPFVMHDATLDRTTDCGGAVAERLAKRIDKCHVDLRGTVDVSKRVKRPKQRVPRLAAVLRWAKRHGVRLNIEVNNYPGPGYDTTSRFVEAELNAIGRSGIRKRKVVIQSFLPGNLTEARRRGYRTAIITFAGGNARALEFAKTGGNQVLEPQWPVDRAFVKRAHAAGRKVIPYTINKRTALTAAFAAGVDGVITDDPARGRKALRCFVADRRYRAARRQLAAAKRALKNAHGGAARRRAAARVKAAERKVARTRRARGRACA
jgi:glycerophosphoryl diester phosphodiesterase